MLQLATPACGRIFSQLRASGFHLPKSGVAEAWCYTDSVTYSHILFQVEESGIALLTVNRPEKLNALSAAVIGELADAFGRVASDPGIRAVVLTGAGEKAFVAGADIGELVALSPFDARAFAERGQAVFRQLETCGKPSVAAVNGFALGGGLELALACTVRFASENAKLGQPEVKLGIIPGYGGTQRLARLVGRGRALELLLSGETIVAAEAYRIGLVNAVVPAAELLDYCRGWLGKVLANGPLAVGLVMDAVDVGLSSGLEEGLRFEAAAFGVSAATDDCREGTRAFLEKRRAAFTGK
jgi:enoyl-CoA hydratase